MTTGVEFKDGHWWANVVDSDRGARSFLCESESEAQRFLNNFQAGLEQKRVEEEMMTARRMAYEEALEGEFMGTLRRSIMELHEPCVDGHCTHCTDQDWPCTTYRVARDS